METGKDKPLFQIDKERLLRVAEALRRGDGDLSECKVNDIRHVSEILAKLLILQELAPGFLDELFDFFIPYFLRKDSMQHIEALAEKNADQGGFGDEWREAMQAVRSEKKKDYIYHMVNVVMKSKNWSQAEAVREIAKHLGRDEDSVRKSVTRSKARKKH